MRFKPLFNLHIYLLIFGLISLYALFFRPSIKQNFTSSEVLGAKTNLTAFIEPDDGRDPLLYYFRQYPQQLIEVYLLSDAQIIDAISQSARVMLEEHPFGGGGLNQKTKPILETRGILTNWTNPYFSLTHEKSIIFGDKVVCILTMNLSKASFEKNREYNVCSENPNEVSEAKAIFEADWNRSGYQAKASNLIVSPDNSRGKITALINSAQKSIDIEMEVISDEKIINLLSERSKNISLRIIVPPNIAPPSLPHKTLQKPYVHAKLILIDKERAYVGSINLTSQSMDKNRELGIIVSQPDIVKRFADTFQKDWDIAL